MDEDEAAQPLRRGVPVEKGSIVERDTALPVQSPGEKPAAREGQQDDRGEGSLPGEH